MKGQYFVHVSADSSNPNMRQIRRGQIMGHVGQEHWLLKFQGQGYTFNNVLPTGALTDFALFDTLADQGAWLSANFPPPPSTSEAAGVSSVGQTGGVTAPVVSAGGETGPSVQNDEAFRILE